ncbi:MAG: KpsF/GutQ family sugar-phosphate isomerase [Nitrospinaceae bacterium]
MRALKISPKEQAKLNQLVIETAKRVLKTESESVADLIGRIDETFVEVVHLLAAGKGRVVIVGMGKSGMIGKKIAGTFSSIGLPTLFLHAAEGSHGDMGMISKGDIVIALSNSGETEEIVKLLPSFNRLKCTLIALTGNTGSTLAKRSDYVLDISVKEEACLKGLVPTSSTTAALAMGDALAMAFLEVHGFREEDFAQNHPGGSLGKKLLWTVGDLMHAGDDIPKVGEDTGITDLLKEMSEKRLGMTTVVDKKGNLTGIITDGDLRRMIERKKDVHDVKARDLMSGMPKIIKKDNLAAKAVQVMEEHSITSLVVSDDKKSVDGIIHLHDLLKAGIV